MPSLSSLFHHKKDHKKADVSDAVLSTPANLESPSISTTSSSTSASSSERTPVTYAPGTGPAAHDAVSRGNNIGMLSGAVIGASIDQNPVMGMVEGQVVGNMIAQRVQQEKKHQFYKEQALRYREGLPVEAVGGGAEGGERSERAKRREERRLKRWGRRGERRDGGQGGSSSDEDS